MSCVGCTLNLKKDDGNKKTKEKKKVKNSGTWREATRSPLVHSALGRMCPVMRHGSALGLPAVAPCCAGGGGALNNLHAGIFFPQPHLKPEPLCLIDSLFLGRWKSLSPYVDGRGAEWGRKDPISPVDSAGVRR